MSKVAKLRYILLYVLFNFVTYFGIKFFVTNDYNFLIPLDEVIPFIPEFIWIYHSLFPVIIWSFWSKIKSEKDFMQAFWSIMFATITINTCYMLFPSFYPYPEFSPEGLSGWLTFLTHSVDSASNTMPSGHVCFSFLTYLSVKDIVEKKQKKYYFIWAASIALSTLFLKQHYVVDVIAGWALAMFSFYGVKYGTEIRNRYRFRKAKKAMLTLQ